MSLGYCEALLIDAKQAFLENAPESKVTPPGFIQGLLENTTKPQAVAVDQGNGHRKQVRVKYLQRANEDATSTTDSCDINAVPAYSEALVDVTGYRQLAIYVPDDEIRKYCSEASQMVNGGGRTSMMRDHLNKILAQMNGLYSAIDGDLVTQMAASFGVNATTGNNASKAINISKNTQIQSLSDGVIEILKDYAENEGCGTPWIVGNGLMHSYVMQQMANVGFNQNGVQMAAFQNAFKFYWDAKTIAGFGANQIGVFQPNAVQLIEYNKYKGSFAGVKGTSEFGTFVDPRVGCMNGGSARMMEFDIQLKYFDCPFTGIVDGVPTQLSRGYALIVSKSFELFTVPANAYDAADRLNGNNGTLRYTLSNNCDICS